MSNVKISQLPLATCASSSGLIPIVQDNVTCAVTVASLVANATSIFIPGAGTDSTIRIGGNNTATGPNAAVLGGCSNTASEQCSSVTTGRYNIASGIFSIISNGYHNTASGYYSSVVNGSCNTRSEERRVGKEVSAGGATWS